MTGKPIVDPKDAVAVWTHPRDTHALLEFCEPGFAADPRLVADWTAVRWRVDHPLALEHTSHITLLFEDLAGAQATYGDALQGRLIHSEDVPGVRRSAFYAVGEETVIEAVQPLSTDTAEGRDFAEFGEGVFALTFKTADLEGAAAFLQEKGHRLDPAGSDTFNVNIEDSFGLRLAFTNRTIPGDLR